MGKKKIKDEALARDFLAWCQKIRLERLAFTIRSIEADEQLVYSQFLRRIELAAQYAEEGGQWVIARRERHLTKHALDGGTLSDKSDTSKSDSDPVSTDDTQPPQAM